MRPLLPWRATAAFPLSGRPLSPGDGLATPEGAAFRTFRAARRGEAECPIALDQALANRLRDGLGAAARAELVLDVPDERLDRPLRVGEPFRDRLRRLAGGEQPQNLEPALVQAARNGRRLELAHL